MHRYAEQRTGKKKKHVWIAVLFAISGLICSCTAMIMLLVPEKMIAGLEGMELLQTAYKVLALVMLFVGGIAAYHIVWDLGDVGIGLMTIFNIVTLYLMGGEALEELRKYEKNKQQEELEDVKR